MKNENYTLRGKVLDKYFTEDIYASGTEDEVVSHVLYVWFEGNMSCDCNKRNLFGYSDKHPCGDTVDFQELKLVSREGKVIDLLLEQYERE